MNSEADPLRKCFDSEEQYMDFMHVLSEGIERVDILDIPDTDTDMNALPLDDNQTLIVITARQRTLFYSAVNAPVAAVDAAFELIDGTDSEALIGIAGDERRAA